MSDETPKYRWPWVLLLLFLLAILLAVLWMLPEFKRMERIRDLNNPPPPTHQVTTNSMEESR